MIDVNTFPPSSASASREHSVKSRAITFALPRRIQFSRDTSHRVSEDATSVCLQVQRASSDRETRREIRRGSCDNFDKVSEEADLR